MAITNYSEVVTKISQYLARSDLDTYIPDFIVGAETRIAYGSDDPLRCNPVRVRAMETFETLTPSAGAVTLPSGYLSLISIYEDNALKGQLEETSPEDFYRKYTGSVSGCAKFYTILGDQLILGPSGTSNIKVVYYKKFDPIATATSTNWLLSNAPMVYVYGALLETAPFIRNDARINTWLSLYCSAVGGVNSADKRGRLSGSALAVRSDAGNP